MHRDKVKKIFSDDDEGILPKKVMRRAAASEFDYLPSFIFESVSCSRTGYLIRYRKGLSWICFMFWESEVFKAAQE